MASVFKTFTSTTLPASDVNTYLMKQVLIVVDDAASRPGSPVEGMAIHQKDTDQVFIHNGSAWVEVLRLGAWTSYTPTLTNFTNATPTGAYVRLAGRTIAFWAQVALGVAPVVSNPAGVSLPVAMASTQAGGFRAYFLDNGSAFYDGIAIPAATSRVDLYALSTSGSYSTYAGLNSSSVPFAMVVGDALYVSGVYEAASST